jgi:hypothetical protein
MFTLRPAGQEGGDHEPRSASSNVPTEYQFTANRPRRVSRARLGWRGEFREYRRQLVSNPDLSLSGSQGSPKTGLGTSCRSLARNRM